MTYRTIAVPSLSELQAYDFHCFHCGAHVRIHSNKVTARCSNLSECGISFTALRQGEQIYHVLFRLEHPNSSVFGLWLQDYLLKHEKSSSTDDDLCPQR